MILKLRHYPDPVLREPAAPVTNFGTEELKTFARDMIDTMIAEGGVGLASPQVGISIRLIVIDVSPLRDSPLIIINPEIVARSKAIHSWDEGCLSFPGVYMTLRSHKEVKVKFQDLDGQSQELTATGLLAVCIQHEIDHLNGKLFLDRTDVKTRAKIKARSLKP